VVHFLYASIIRPTVFSHPCYGGLIVGRPVPRKKTRQYRNKSMLRDNWSKAHCYNQYCGSTYLPPLLELVVKREARSAARRLWSLGSWSYLHPSGGPSSILMRLQMSDPLFNMSLSLCGLHNNFEPKYGVNKLIREDWTKGTSSLTAVKGLVWFTEG